MQKEAVKQFRPERVVLVDEFRTSRVSSADNTPSETLLDTPPESFRWLRPVYSKAKRSQVRGLMCLTSINNITRFYDRDVSAALNIRRCAVGPGPRPTELHRHWHRHTHQKTELKWAVGSRSVAFTMMSSQPGLIPTHVLFCCMRAVGFRS
ncbi:hypothetical protein HaLaN_11268, partial [Haematococcus lacustris]